MRIVEGGWRFGAALLACLAPATALAAPAQRVVTLAPHLAELVCAAGGCERLVGVAEYTDYPAAAARVPRVGNAFSVNPEAVLALKPDLVLAWDGGTNAALTDRLRPLGFEVRAVAIRKLDDVAGALLSIGEWLGTTPVAAAAAEDYRKRLRRLSYLNKLKTPVRVLFQIEVEPLYTVNRDSPISEAIERCGGSNVFAGMTQLSAPINTEAALAADPDAVVFGQQDFVERIRAFWAAFPQARAQRLGNLYAVDSSLLARQAPRLLDGMEQLCAALDQARARMQPAPVRPE